MESSSHEGSVLPTGAHEDLVAFHIVAQKRGKVSFAVSYAMLGTTLFLLSAYVLCSRNISDPELEQLYKQEASPQSYSWPMVAFGTAFTLNFITLMFERESAKFQLALLACYINFLAGLSDYLCYRNWQPIVRDPWGQGYQPVRMVMWLLTTPAMVYLLSIISDLSIKKVYIVMLMDVLMVTCGIVMHLSRNVVFAWLMWIPAGMCFAYVITSMWRMFNVAINEARADHNRGSLLVLRAVTVGLWFAFPATWLLVKLGLVDRHTEEWLWCVGDFLGKVMFSSSLLHGNFLTIEQRRIIAMRIVEESNRIQVIKELKDLVEQKESFLSSISHELRTPLNGIIGLSDAMLVGSCGDISAQVRKTITTIKTSGSRLLNLINDILDAAAMKKGKLTVKQERVNLKRLVDDVVELCVPLAKRGVKLVNDIGDNVPPVLGDTGRIIQVFYNLIGNSCKFTHTGFIGVTAVVKLDEVEISVSDTGIGIPEDKYEQIFQAFEQVDMSTTRKYGGTGLGLNLVKQLVEAHGGKISVKSKEGVGTTFYFTLKVHPDKDRRSSLQSQHHSASSSRVSREWPSTGSAVTAAATATTTASGTTSADGKPPSSGAPASGSGGPPTSSGKAKKPPGKRASFASQIVTSIVAAATAPAMAPTKEVIAKSRLSNSSVEQGQEEPVPVSSREGYANVKSPMLGPASARPMTLDAAAALVQAVKRRPSFGLRSNGGKVRVLSVDDDPVNQMVIQNLLSPAGYEIVQAMDGTEALQILSQAQQLPDIILLDVMMPGMSGYEVCRKLRGMYPMAAIPVIMVSAKSKEENIVEGLTSGSNDYVVKPFGRQEILARINAHLNFRDTVYMAAEDHLLGGSEKTSMSGLHELQSANSELQCVPAAAAAATVVAAATAATAGCVSTTTAESAAQLAKLRHEKCLLEKQLEEVSEEAARLQDEVDRLEASLRSQSQAAAAAQADAAKARVEAGVAQEGWRAAEAQLQGWAQEVAGLQELVGALEQQLHDTQAKQQQQESAAAAAATGQQQQQQLPEAVLEDLAKLRERARALEMQLLVVSRERQALETQLKDTTAKLEAAKAALVQAETARAAAAVATLAAMSGSNGDTSGSTAAAAAAVAAAAAAAANGSHDTSGGALAAAFETASVVSDVLSQAPMVLGGDAQGRAMSRALASYQSLITPSQDIRNILDELGLAGLAPRFEAEEVTPALLPFLDDSSLRELGATSVGARLKLRLAAQALYS